MTYSTSLQRTLGIGSLSPRAYRLQVCLLLMAMMFFGAPKAVAEANDTTNIGGIFGDSEIDAGDITITNHLYNGFIEVTVPVYENKNLDEWLLPNDSKIYINDEHVLTLNSSRDDGDPQDPDTGKGQLVFCHAINVNPDYRVFSYSGNPDSPSDPTKLIELLHNKWVFGYYANTENHFFATYLIYPTGEKLSKKKDYKVKVHLTVDVNDRTNHVYIDKETSSDFIYTAPSGTTVRAGYSENHPGKHDVYFTGSQGDQYQVDNGAVTDINTEGEQHFYFDVQNDPRNVSVTYYKRVSSFSHYPFNYSVELPAYQFPNDFTATMNKSGDVELTWSVPQTTKPGTVLEKDNFQIQQSPDPSFPDDRTTTVNSVAFEKGQTNYSLTHKTSELNLNGIYYYRLRRTAVPHWNWTYVRSDTVALSMSHRYVKKPTAKMSTDKASDVVLTWSYDEGTIWTEKSAIMIERTNTTKGTSTTYSIPEEKIDTLKGDSLFTYTESLPTTCDVYKYKIYVKPGNNNYDTQVPIDVTSGNDLFTTNMGKVISAKASKGYYSEFVDINWTTDGNPILSFEISSRVYGSNDDYVLLGSVEGSGALTSYQYSDHKSVPGVLYEYIITSIASCGNDKQYVNSKSFIGFRTPTGDIYGRVTYENGQAVPNVEVRAEATDGSGITGKSYRFDSGDMLTINDSTLLKADTERLTMQAWATCNDGNIIKKDGMFSLAIKGGKALFTVGSQSIESKATLTSLLDDQETFVHITGAMSVDSLYIYLNGKLNATARRTATITGNDNRVVIGGDGFKGNIDEVRLWGDCLDASVIQRDYGRYLIGSETNLRALYTFDYCSTYGFYDTSYKGTVYNENDGTVMGAEIDSDNTPTIDQLCYKAYTADDGTYQIRALPYIGNGTTYLIVPRMGSHSFASTKELRLVNNSSQNHTVNFTDESSFLVQGYVRYEGGTVPVEGVQFLIDGVPATDDKSQIITTDATGQFKINVPVGIHEVKASKANHVFVNDGRITNSDGTDRNYQDMVTGIELYDATKVRYIGRLTGGAVEEGKLIGHSLSKNNLGDGIKVTLTYQNNAYEMTLAERTDTLDHLNPGNRKNFKPNTNEVNFKGNTITIHPNLTTGEYIADLIPEKYDVKISAPGYEIYAGKLGGLLDLTNAFGNNSEVYEYTDSVKRGNETIGINYSDTAYFNKKQIFSIRVSPEIEVKQLTVRGGSPLDYFGEDSVDVSANNTTIKKVSYDKTTGNYLLGRPIFITNNTYDFQASIHEAYRYYDASGNISKGKEINTVPCEDAVLEYTATMENPLPVSVEANDYGIVEFSVTCGTPDLLTATASLTAKAKLGVDGTSFDWNSGIMAKHIVMGTRLTGNNFITNGPDQIITVLRDPPGSNSYAYLEKGTTFTTTTTTYKGVELQSFGFTTEVHSGLKIFAVNPYNGMITESQAKNEYTLGATEKVDIVHQNTTKATTTATTRYQTSSDPLYVGSRGDLFIGKSSNIIFGESRTIEIVDKATYKAMQSLPNDFFTAYETLTPTNGDYVLIEHNSISLTEKFNTLFAYPQVYIEETLIPNMKKTRNSLLRSKEEKDSVAFQTEANTKGKAIYVSLLSADDPNYGKSNNDVAFGVTKEDVFKGPSYRIYFPKKDSLHRDTIHGINQSIQMWEKELRKNEQQKAEAIVKQNYSFHSASPIEYSESYSHVSDSSLTYEIGIYTQYLDKFGYVRNGTGKIWRIESDISTAHGENTTTSEEVSQTKGFVLADDPSGRDYYSVDVCTEATYDENGQLAEIQDNKFSSFIFKVRGGMSEGPHEGKEYTKYYMPGSIVLNEGTTQIEMPKISVEKDFIDNVPSGSPAHFKFYIMNDSEANLDCIFSFFVSESSNPHGAKFTMDGAPFGGRTIYVPAGEVIEKTLEVHKGTVMNYDNLQICLHSLKQYDGRDSWPDIGEYVNISVHFTPSATPVNIKKPADNFIYNTQLPTKLVDGVEKYYQEVLIDGFDVNYDNFHKVMLQYKPSSNTDEQWVTLMNYYASDSLYQAALKRGENAGLIKSEDKGTIRYEWIIDEPDQYYDLRAVGVSMVNNEQIENFSDVHTGIKDMYTPRLFGTAQPANGVLTISDDVRLNFNEKIADGLLTVNNFQVTGVRNGAQGDHSVSVSLDGQNDALTSEFTRNWSNKDLTVEMWMKPDSLHDAVLFSQGNEASTFEFGITADAHLKVKIGKTEIVSPDVVPYEKGNWAHVAVVYEKLGMVSAYYNFVKVIDRANVDVYNGNGAYTFGASINGGGHFAGQMHGARIWDKVISSAYLQANSLNIYSGYESNLLAYYPMTEAKGNVVYDKARGANLEINGSEWSLPEGRSAKFNGTDQYVRVSTGSTAVFDGEMDYTMEFWFRAAPGQQNATLVANGRGDGKEYGSSRNLFSLGFEEGLLTFRNNGEMQQIEGDYLDNDWHHLALALSRTAGGVRVFIDGKLKTYFSSENLGAIAAPYIYFGARGWTAADTPTTVTVDNFFKGEIDEFRLWKLYKNESLVANGNSERLDGTEMGLVAYYPFEHYIDWQGTKELQFTLKDMKKQKDAAVTVPDGEQFGAASVETSATAPVKDKGPSSSLLYDFVVNDDALIINLEEPLDRIEKTIVTFSVEGVRDVNGNILVSPISWCAYIDRNQLRWSESELAIKQDAFEESTFTVKAVNNGGTVQNFTIKNAPAWLDVSKTSGTINPLSSANITFTIDEGLNIGDYDEMIYLVNENNVSEALALNVSVRGERPEWSVNPADFKYSMSVIGKIRTNGCFSSDEDDLLAAFKNGNCIGVTNNYYDKKNDMWYSFLTVYSNETQADNLEFRIWDASTGKVYCAVPDQTITFKADAIYGDKAPVIFEGKEMLYQDITLNAGWNWLSFNLASTSMTDVTAALANGEWTDEDVIKTESVFDAYSTATGKWTGSLSASGGLNNSQLYFVKSSEEQVLSMTGSAIDASHYPLTIKGGRWNYISYLPTVNCSLQEALAGYDVGNGDIVKSQTQFSVYSGGSWIGNLTYMVPNHGYMLLRNDSSTTTFCYPTTSGTLSEPNRVATRSIAETNGYVNTDYAENMGIIATTNVAMTTDDRILAFIDGELRGASDIVTTDNGQTLHFITISGETAEEMITFVLERNGEIVAETAQGTPFRANTLNGSVKKPTLIDFALKENMTVYPSPFVNETTITIPVTEAGTLEFGIYDISGQLLLFRSENVDKGLYRTTWDGRTAAGSACEAGLYVIRARVNGNDFSTKVIKK